MRKPILQYAVAICVLSSAVTAQAVIRSVSAELVSQVSDQNGSSDQAIENFGDTGLTLPISTRANLVAFDGAGAATAEGISLADFRDLTAAGPGRNPEEIGIEADCFSNDSSTSYDLESSVVETRIVSFDADELGLPPFSTSSSSSQTVNSTVFASGAMLLFSVDDDRNLTGLSAEVSFVVERFDIGDNDEPTGDGEVLVDKTVSLNGGANGSVTLQSDPDLFVFAGDLTILPDDPAGTGTGIGDVDLGAVTVAQVAIILGQNISYSYEASVGQEFILQATFKVTASNLPNGTGVVAVFGRGLDEAVRILELGIPEESAKSVVRRVNRAIDEFTPKEDGGADTATLSGIPCAMLGFEMIPLGLLSLTFLIGRGTRRGRIDGHTR